METQQQFYDLYVYVYVVSMKYSFRNLYLGTDEAQLIGILADRCNRQRVEIRLRYKTMYGKVNMICLN